ncbi:MAG: AmmeMemoRadiSam system protein A [Candidatus Pacebacteria bacterium]|nr:AmmeMemoRadiSam system protein A [Candidatus Paceibacterota bacterium]
MHPFAVLAKKAVETYINEGKIISLPSDLSKEFLEKKAGAFVTLEKNGKLRGCIGTYLPTRNNVAEEIIYNAISAATEDYRFDTVQADELPQLSYTVYILNEPGLISDIKELNPKKFGIIVRSGRKCGLLLPDLEGVDTVEEQISICCQKGGIDPKEKISIYKFTVEKYQ